MSNALLHALREALYLVLLLSAPVVLAVLAAGVASALLQTVTQVRERSLSSVPKLLAALVALAVTGSWIGAQMITFLRSVLAAVPAAGHAGGP
jgi:flagellar biosynthesis protein FliQ